MRGLRAIHGDRRSSLFPNVSSLVGALGAPAFPNRMFDFFGEMGEIDHCGVYMLKQQRLSKYAAMSRDGSDKSRRFVDLYIDDGHWLADPTIHMIESEGLSYESFLIEVDTTTLGSARFREQLYLSQNMHHRLMACFRMDSGLAILDLVRAAHHGPFDQGSLATFNAVTDFIVPLIFKHFQVVGEPQSFDVDIFRDLNAIDKLMAAKAVHLPLRERQVAGRILYGQSSLGIAIDLGIGEETVATYRKRLYSRLKISSQQELCRWFLQNA